MSQDRPKQPHFMNHHQIEKTVASISIEIRNAVATSLNHSRGLNHFPFAFSPNSTNRRMLGSAFCNLTARAGWHLGLGVISFDVCAMNTSRQLIAIKQDSDGCSPGLGFWKLDHSAGLASGSGGARFAQLT